MPLLFPDGRLPSPRWRPLAWLSAIPIVVIPMSTAVALWPWRGPALLNPNSPSQGMGDLRIVLGFAPYLLMLGSGLACLAALLLRFRQARGVERQQLKWLLFACAVTIAIFVVVQPNTSDTWQLGLLLALPFFLSVPVAAATLAAAAAFRPIRRRIQAVDRRSNRRRYNAAQTIEAFSARLRDHVDLDSLSTELMAVADHTMEPTLLCLWLRSPAERSQRSSS